MPRSTLQHLRTAGAALFLVAAATLGAPTAASATAPTDTAGTAASCPWTRGAPAAQNNPYETVDRAAETTPVHEGPYEACGTTGSYAKDTPITVMCYVANSYGNTWSYVHGSGWVWDEHLAGYGSPDPCVF